MFATNALLQIHIPNENFVMVRVRSQDLPVDGPSLEAIDFSWVDEYFLNFQFCLLALQLLLVCTSRASSTDFSFHSHSALVTGLL